MDWHTMSISEVMESLKTSFKGLSNREVIERIKEYGYNELAEKKKSPLLLFIKQFLNFLILILIISALVAGFLGEVIDAAAIILIVLVMGIAGFVQEFRAEKAIEALKSLSAPHAVVIREGRKITVPARELVPGDILVLKEGDRVPADARLIETYELLVDESPLTGESIPVRKDHDIILGRDTPLPERRNMVFSGTHVISGKALAVVVATGMSTFLGSIAESLGEIEEKRTLLEEDLDKLGKKLGIVILGISGIVFMTSVFLSGYSFIDALLLAIALAVAAIPEGLPAVATSVLAIGAHRMAKKNVLVRELGAIETLGACDVIASDKTGTITKGEMTVREVFIGGKVLEVGGSGYEPRGPVQGINDPYLGPLLKKVAEYLVRHIKEDVELIQKNGKWFISGSPTEGAALVFAVKVLGLEQLDKVRRDLVKIYPFDRFRKRKTTVHLEDGRYLVVSSGAPEMLLEISSRVDTGKGVEELTPDQRGKIIRHIDAMASRGFRTYAVAYKVTEKGELPATPEEVEKDLIFTLVFGIIDPPREGVREAVEEVSKAGIKVIMITGDHKLTAMAVGRMIGLEFSEDMVIEGKDLDKLSDEEFEDICEKIVIYARVTPQHKRRIVQALRKKGHVVAMTGDGVNDAPALKEADIGVAMGIRGTDVAKEVSKLVIRDDNFVSIVEAVREGRIIYENLKKPINYLLPANIGEVTTIFLTQLAGLPPPLTAPQLLWVNVTTDALPAISLSAEPPEPDIMKRPPRRRKSSFITNRKLLYYTIIGSVIGIVNVLIFSRTLNLLGIAEARTLVFAAMAFSEFGRALAARSESRHFWSLPFNKWLLPALLASVALQLIAIYVPGFNEFFSAVPLPADVLGLAMLTALPVLLIDEARKSLRISL